MYYLNRWAYLNHWIQPDSIVPDPTKSETYDRYAYNGNNPIKRVDPSGHTYCDFGKCRKVEPKLPTSNDILNKYKEIRTRGGTNYWNNLEPLERAILKDNKINEVDWNERIEGPGVTPADPLHDPLVWLDYLLLAGLDQQHWGLLPNYPKQILLQAIAAIYIWGKYIEMLQERRTV
jgi:hypothetical protein